MQTPNRQLIQALITRQNNPSPCPSQDIEAEHDAGNRPRDPSSRSQATMAGQMLDKVGNMFGMGRQAPGAGSQLAQVGVLKPSLKATKLMKRNSGGEKYPILSFPGEI